MPYITVFTPTYNRKKTLARLYHSLCSQSSFDFEWLIVDDGSTDGTDEYVAALSTTNFDIRYIKKQNGGKHTAYNIGIKEARGDYFICVDSDDMLSTDAIEIIAAAAVPHAGICAYKETTDGKMLSSVFTENLTAAKTFALYDKYGLCGEYTFVYPTDIVRQEPYPTFTGEKFVTESVVFDRLDKHCSVIPVPRTVTICEYQTDGLSATANRLLRDNPAGYCLYFMQRIDLVGSWRARATMIGKYRCFSLFAGKQRSEYSGRYKLACTLLAPLGWLFWCYYKLCRDF